jgi:hypothetical protein
MYTCFNNQQLYILYLCVLYNYECKQIMSKITVVLDVAPCSLVEIDRRFRGVYCLHHQGAISTRLHGATSQKTVIFIPVSVRTLNFIGIISLDTINHSVFVMEIEGFYLCFSLLNVVSLTTSLVHSDSKG